jgi:hypothetical protein
MRDGELARGGFGQPQWPNHLIGRKGGSSSPVRPNGGDKTTPKLFKNGFSHPHLATLEWPYHLMDYEGGSSSSLQPNGGG